MVNLSVSHKIIGYFSSSEGGNVFCDGDACVIAGTEELLHFYIKQMLPHHQGQHIVKKTKFEKIMGGLGLGGAYAFDKEAYAKFFPLCGQCGIIDLPEPKSFFAESESSSSGLHFIRIQFDVLT